MCSFVAVEDDMPAAEAADGAVGVAADIQRNESEEARTLEGGDNIPVDILDNNSAEN